MSTSAGWSGSLRWRLLAAFLAVAVGAVGLLALVAAVSVDRRTATLLDAQQSQLREQIGTALAAAYSAGREAWPTVDLSRVQALATAQGAQVEIWDRAGRQVATVTPGNHDDWEQWGMPSAGPSSGSAAPKQTTPGRASPLPSSQPTHDWSGGTRPTPESHPSETSPTPWATYDEYHMSSYVGTGSTTLIAPAALLTLPHVATASGAASVSASTPATAAPSGGQQVTVPIVVNGAQVGTARLTLPSSAGSPISAARSALLRSVWLGAFFAVLLAALAAVVVSRRISRPLVALVAATRSFAAGEPDPERMLRPAPGELGEVGRAFSVMATKVRREDELRRAVVADVAHELRTPVTILRGQTEQLLDGVAEPTPARMVSLHDEVLRLERLTDDLATLSAADAVGLALHCEPVDLGRLTGSIVEAMGARFDDAELHISLDTDNDTGSDTATSTVVSGDPIRLAQVVTNLLTNAAKFTPSGGDVTVAVHRCGAQVELIVSDTGPGIPADELPHLFERFWRGRAAGARSGTGIGLAVVNTLVTAHQGSVTAATLEHGGARFTVRLPAAGPQDTHRAGPGPASLA